MDKQSRRDKHKRNQAQKNKHKPAHVKEKFKTEEEVPTIVTKQKSDLNEAQSSVNEKKSNVIKQEKVVEEEKLVDSTREENEGEFSKRKIVSNWDKYEERTEELPYGDRLRGSDFNEILQLGTGGSSFKFKEERSWDEELLNGPKLNEFFAIDVNDLNNAMLCVPLPRRLLIGEEFIPRKMLNKMEKIAQQNHAQYVQGRLKTEEIIREMFVATEKVKMESEEVEDEDEIEIEIEDIQKELVKDKDNVNVLEKSDEIDLNLLLESKDFVSEDICEPKKENEPIITTSVTTSAVDPKSIKLFSESKTEDLEDWLDTLLDAD